MFSVTGAVPQSGTAAVVGTAEGTIDPDGAVVGEDVATGPGAAHPVAMTAANPRAAKVLRAVVRPVRLIATAFSSNCQRMRE